MSTAHIDAELTAAIEASKALKAKNDAEMKRLLVEQAEADQTLVDNVEAAAALSRAAQQRYEDESESRNHALAQAKRIAGSSSNDDKPDKKDEDDKDDSQTRVLTKSDKPDSPAKQPRNNRDPLQWGRFARWMAVVGVIIGFVIALFTYSPLWHDANKSDWYNFLVLVWFLILMASGFFTVGWLGAILEEHKEKHDKKNPSA